MAGARQKLLSLLAVVAIWVAAPVFGLTVPVWGAVALAAGAVAVGVWPSAGRAATLAAGVCLLLVRVPRYATYHLALIVALYVARRRTRSLALVLLVGALVAPKTLFAVTGGRALSDGWLDPSLLAAAIFTAATWWREVRDGKAPPAARTSFAAWASLFLLPFNPIYPIVFGPQDLWRPRRVDVRLVLGGAALCLVKAGALAASRRVFPSLPYAAWSAPGLLALSPGRLWLVVAGNYLQLVLLLSGLAEAGILAARLTGWPLPSPFRFALLAWNPVELWRRWGIYTRRFLLKTIYFPLGGSTRHRTRNVLLTFLASALVLHSGWLGSPYWIVGAGGWRDHTLYFGLQGLAVCACLGLWQIAGKDPRADRALRWSAGRALATVATQAFSAWAHLLILPQAIPLGARARLMIRCLGL